MYIGIDEPAFTMEVPLNEMALIDNPVIHLQFPKAVIPAFFILPLILVVEPGCHSI